jgi:hypothetical protein
VSDYIVYVREKDSGPLIVLGEVRGNTELEVARAVADLIEENELDRDSMIEIKGADGEPYCTPASVAECERKGA